MDPSAAQQFIDQVWSESITPRLLDYIGIPNESPAFDPQWAEHGHMERVVNLARTWCRAQPVRDMTVEVVRLPGRTPLLYVEVEGSAPGTTLLYGHLDKQPGMHGWRDGLGPWTPVLEGDRLYGRGGADDGYAVFASLTAIAALQAQGVGHGRCVILIECCEWSGSVDLPAYLDLLAPRIGAPELVVCLDSGCGDYERLWCTTSLRGLVGGVLTVDILTEGVHSGDAGGVVPCSFRLARMLLSRLESENDGVIKPEAFQVPIPPVRRAQAQAAAAVLGAATVERFPWAAACPVPQKDPAGVILDRTWRPALAVVGAGGLPTAEQAGNVLRPTTALKLSLRLPPTCDPGAAARALQALLERDPPPGARVRFEPDWGAAGWNAPEFDTWFAAAVDRASREWFGAPAAAMGEGGTIPFMAMLGNRFPQAQFLITGVLGPHANAHGPNEFLHLPTARRLTGCVARILVDAAVSLRPGGRDHYAQAAAPGGTPSKP